MEFSLSRISPCHELLGCSWTFILRLIRKNIFLVQWEIFQGKKNFCKIPRENHFSCEGRGALVKGFSGDHHQTVRQHSDQLVIYYYSQFTNPNNPPPWIKKSFAFLCGRSKIILIYSIPLVSRLSRPQKVTQHYYLIQLFCDIHTHTHTFTHTRTHPNLERSTVHAMQNNCTPRVNTIFCFQNRFRLSFLHLRVGLDNMVLYVQ